jgi:predicted RNA-binding Zn ribbon-like protein
MIRPDLCLDFANTRYWRGQTQPTETLNAPADLATWAKTNEVPTGREFEASLALRETIYRLFDANAQGRAPPGTKRQRCCRKGEPPLDW